MTDVEINFVRYCRAFLKSQCGLSEPETKILVCDPELGPIMDKAKRKWVWEDLPANTDPDEFLISMSFDAPEMKHINNILLSFAKKYSSREHKIIAYLRSIGHPMGNYNSNI